MGRGSDEFVEVERVAVDQLEDLGHLSVGEIQRRVEAALEEYGIRDYLDSWGVADSREQLAQAHTLDEARSRVDDLIYNLKNGGASLQALEELLYPLALDEQQLADRKALYAEIDDAAMALVANDPGLIRIWGFHDAPEPFCSFMNQGGDEDWLALVPPSHSESYLSWLDEGSTFVVCNREEKLLPSGCRLIVSTHS